jgi:predicted GTPase
MSSFRYIPPDFEQRCSAYWTALVNFYETGQHENSASWLEAVRQSLNLEQRDAEAIQAVYLRDHATMIIPQLLATVEHLNRENAEFRMALRRVQQEMATADQPDPETSVSLEVPAPERDRQPVYADDDNLAGQEPERAAVADPDVLKIPEWMLPLYDLINRQQVLTTRLGLTAETKHLDALRSCMQTSVLCLMFVGRFASGKSTLINALLGTNVLPVGAVPTTGVPIEVSFSPTAQATVMLSSSADRETVATRSIEWAELPDYAMVAPRVKNKRQGSPGQDTTERISLRWPLPLLQNQVFLIDTPGLNHRDEVNQQMTQYIAQTDIVVYVSRLDSSLTLDEQQWFQQAMTLAGHQMPFFVLNKHDEMTEQTCARLEARWRSILVDYSRPYAGGLFVVNALDALEGHVKHDPEQVARSGIEAFRERLMQVVLHERWYYKFWRTYFQLRATASSIRQILTDLVQQSETSSLETSNILNELTAIQDALDRCRNQYIPTGGS